jgi:hypothetical protein
MRGSGTRPPQADLSPVLTPGCWRSSAADSAPSGLLRHTLQLAPIRLLPGLVSMSHVVVTWLPSGGPVNQFPNDVGVAGVPMGLRDDVHQDPLQRRLTALSWSPWDPADGIQLQRPDGSVRVPPYSLVQVDDVLRCHQRPQPDRAASRYGGSLADRADQRKGAKRWRICAIAATRECEPGPACSGRSPASSATTRTGRARRRHHRCRWRRLRQIDAPIIRTTRSPFQREHEPRLFAKLAASALLDRLSR